MRVAKELHSVRKNIILLTHLIDYEMTVRFHKRHTIQAGALITTIREARSCLLLEHHNLAVPSTSLRSAQLTDRQTDINTTHCKQDEQLGRKTEIVPEQLRNTTRADFQTIPTLNPDRQPSCLRVTDALFSPPEPECGYIHSDVK